MQALYGLHKSLVVFRAEVWKQLSNENPGFGIYKAVLLGSWAVFLGSFFPLINS